MPSFLCLLEASHCLDLVCVRSVSCNQQVITKNHTTLPSRCPLWSTWHGKRITRMLDAVWAMQAILSETHQTQGPWQPGASLDQQGVTPGAPGLSLSIALSLFFGKLMIDRKVQVWQTGVPAVWGQSYTLFSGKNARITILKNVTFY